MLNGSRLGTKYKKIWNKVRDEISRCFYVVTFSRTSVCNNCYYSDADKASSGRYKPGGPVPFNYGRCPVCHGKGVIETKLRKKIKGDIVWKGRASAVAKENLITFYIPGEEDMNIVRIKVGLCHKDLIDNADHIIVDGYKCTILKPLAEAGIQTKASLTFYAKTRDKKDG
jgi:hypothetical protein